MSRARLFGKLPAHGDFVSRGWRGDERNALDAWLSASLADARSAYSADFEPRFDSAPPWRCIADLADNGFAGALAASQDAAGRRFPVFLALVGENSDAAAEACEALLYDAIGGCWTADALVAEADALPVSSVSPQARAGWWTLGGEGFPPAERSDSQPADLLTAMLTVAS